MVTPEPAASELDPCPQAQLACRQMSAAIRGGDLWRALLERLPDTLQDQAKVAVTQDAGFVTECSEEGDEVYKAYFVASVTIARVRARRRIVRQKRRLGPVHSLRRVVDAIKPNVDVCLNGRNAARRDPRYTEIEAWASRANLLSEPFCSHGLRLFSLSSTVKVEVPAALTVPQLHSIRIAFSRPSSFAWVSQPIFFTAEESLLPGRRRFLGKSSDGSLSLFEIADERSVGQEVARRGRPPAQRACALLGAFDGRGSDGDRGDLGVGFISVHMPHTHIIRSVTRTSPGRSSPLVSRASALGKHPAGSSQVLGNLSAAIGLRTDSLPLWETSSVGVVTGRRRSRRGNAYAEHPLPDVSRRSVVSVDVVSPGSGVPHEALTLSSDPSMPFISCGGLSLSVKDVLLCDCALFDENGEAIWSFTRPIVFQSVPVGSDDDYPTDITHTEVVSKRRVGLVEEPGVGCVVVKLALVESSQDPSSVPEVSACHTPAEHLAWTVRMARIELESDYFDDWIRAEHGRVAGTR